MRRYLKKTAVGLLLIFALVLVGRAWILRPRIALDLVIADEEMKLPVHLAFWPGRPDRLVVIEKQGIIKWYSTREGEGGGVLLDLRPRVQSVAWEDGLLSIAFDPRFPESPFFYVFYSAKDPLRSVISRFTLPPQSVTADPSSEMIILEVPKPFEHHNGGQLAFGPEGYLYASIGEGHVQDKSVLQTRKTLLGTIIRLDVQGATSLKPYRIPPDNPFARSRDGSRPEIWAYGFRNPWRFSFDRKTSELYAADVGEVTAEEIDRVVKGGNYGWRIMEGDRCFPPDRNPPVVCDRTGLEMPIASFPRWVSRTVIGGFVYRGQELPSLRGRYVFGDYFRGIYAIPTDAAGIIRVPEVLLYRPKAQKVEKGESLHLSSFSEGPGEELYVVGLRGEVYRMVDLEWWPAVISFLRLMVFQ